MKKKILLALFLALVPTYGWGKCKGPTIACPEDRPYFIGTTLSGYFDPPYLSNLNSLKGLSEEWPREIPDFPFEEECQKTKEPLCERLDEIKVYQKEIKDWYLSGGKEKIRQENKKIRMKNKIIKLRQGIIDQENRLYGEYSSIIKVEKKYEGCGDDFIRDVEGKYTVAFLFDANPKTALQKAIEKYWLEANNIYAEYERFMDDNKRIQEENLKTEKQNAERERKNAEIEKQFLDYYTPEKTEQLIKDYEKAIAEQCLGCDYPEPLSVSKYDCQKCPERIFVDDKCILRESYFKNKKGVKK
ncbi:MAG: hypothetical protein E7021_03705 [Alphaproteobacteria bacterium]|nr:hypothetical protein [Alphaproteobacteria bacterium]